MATEMLPREPGKRKTAIVTIDAENDPDNRDKGKRYLLMEMSSLRFERWFLQLVAKLAREGIRVPATLVAAGAAALTTLPILHYLSWVDDEHLTSELLKCVQAWPDGSPIARTLRETDAEEFKTLLHLRMEVIALHVGFSLAVYLWSALPALATALGIAQPASTPPAQTSHATSPS